MRVFLGAVAVCLTLGLAGCGSDSKPAQQAAAAPKPPPPKPPPATPELAIGEVSKGLAQNKPEVLWQALPASYQKDVNEVVSSFASTCDPELYNESFKLGQKMVRVLKEKKDLIITHPLLAKSGKTQQLAQNWDNVVGLISNVMNSDLADVNKLKALDVEKFLATTGSGVMTNAMALAELNPTADKVDFRTKMSSVLARQLRTEGDTAIVKIEAPGEEPKEERFIQVEGKWIPKDLATDWKQGVGKIKTDLQAAMANAQQQNKKETLGKLLILDGVLDQMLAAKTAADFNSSVEKGVLTVMGLAAPLLQQFKMGAPPGGAPGK